MLALGKKRESLLLLFNTKYLYEITTIGINWEVLEIYISQVLEMQSTGII